MACVTSFLENTWQRVENFGKPVILTTESMRSLTLRSGRRLGARDQDMIFEPFGKNTAPAIGLLCQVMSLQNRQQEIVGIFPSDHLVFDEPAFGQALALAQGCAEKGQVVTLGIQPSRPATGYGYIEVKDVSFEEGFGLQAKRVAAFREKPDLETAKQFVEAGNYFWNAGIFVFRVATMIEHFQTHLPKTWSRLKDLKPDLSNLKHVYAQLEPQSLDYGIMEKLEDQVTVPCDIGWSDMGSWDEMARVSEEIPSARAGSKANVISEDGAGNYVFTVTEKIVGLIGVDDLVVADTPDALLITKRGQSEKVKDLLTRVKELGLPEATSHPFEFRPWGGYENLIEEADYKVKRINVDPGQSISYQYHQRREEHWLVVQGQAEVVLNESTEKKGPGDTIHVPKGAKHRIRNVGADKLVFIEVQRGDYFGEDDIIRLQDDYNRK